MTHEVILKDERGRVRISVTLVTFSHGMTDKDGNSFRYDVSVSVIAPRKRIEIYDSSVAAPHEIWNAKMELSGITVQQFRL